MPGSLSVSTVFNAIFSRNATDTLTLCPQFAYLKQSVSKIFNLGPEETLNFSLGSPVEKVGELQKYLQLHVSQSNNMTSIIYTVINA